VSSEGRGSGPVPSEGPVAAPGFEDLECPKRCLDVGIGNPDILVLGPDARDGTTGTTAVGRRCLASFPETTGIDPDDEC